MKWAKAPPEFAEPPTRTAAPNGAADADSYKEAKSGGKPPPAPVAKPQPEAEADDWG